MPPHLEILHPSRASGAREIAFYTWRPCSTRRQYAEARVRRRSGNPWPYPTARSAVKNASDAEILFTSMYATESTSLKLTRFDGRSRAVWTTCETMSLACTTHVGPARFKVGIEIMPNTWRYFSPCSNDVVSFLLEYYAIEYKFRMQD